MGNSLLSSVRFLIPFILTIVSTPLLANQPIIIDSFTASPSVVAPGEIAVLTVEAHDPDCPNTCTSGCGMYVRAEFTEWVASAGLISQVNNGVSGSPYTATADWQAPQEEGTYTITVTLGDSGSSFMCGGREYTSLDLDVVVTLVTTEPPVIESLTADKMQLFPAEEANLTCVASDPDGDPIVYSWTSDLGSIVPGEAGTAVYTADLPGLGNVTCTATDPFDTFDTASIALSVSGARAEKSIDAALVSPRRIDVDAQGDIYVVDPAAGGITVVNLFSGAFVYHLPLPDVNSIALDWAGNLLTGFSDRAQVLDRRGSVLLSLTNASGDVTGVAVDHLNQRYGVLHRRTGRVVVYDAAGLQITSFGSTGDGPEQLRDPQALAVTPSGKWVVADTGHGQIKIFEPSGLLTKTIGDLGTSSGEFVHLDDVMVDADGVIYASDSFQDWVQTFNPDGTLREAIGTYGDQIGQFRTATGLAMAEGYDTLLAASFNGSSIQVFRTSDAPVVAPPPPSPALTPTSLTFGNQTVGTVSPAQPLTLANTGGSVMGFRALTARDNFSISDDCGDFVDPGQICIIDVVFRPATIGQHDQALIVDTSAEAGRLGATLSGTGTESGPQVRLNPGLLLFGDQEVDTPSAPQPVTLSNEGTLPLALHTIGTSADFQGAHNCPDSLNAGASCTIDVLFVPSRLADNIYGALAVTSAAPGSPHAVDLSGRSTAVIPRITIDDVIVDEEEAGSSEANFTVTLSAPTTQAVSVAYVTEEDSALEDLDFTAVSDTLTISSGQTQGTISVPITGDQILETDEESFRLVLSNPINGVIADGIGVGTILDDEPCIGPNLLANPSGEEWSELPGIPDWTMVTGTSWQRRSAPPYPVDGDYFFYPGTIEYTELVQDIDVSAFANRIVTGDQRFFFEGFVHTLYEAQAETARMIVEYRNLDNSLVLDEFDTGAFSSPSLWTTITDERPAPPGTGWIRVRLISIELGDAYFDALSLRSLRAVTVVLDDLEIYEDDQSIHPAAFNVSIACPFDEDVSLDYATFDGSAVSGEDYLGTVGNLVVPVGDTAGVVEVYIVGDEVDEAHETFTLEVTALEPPDAVLLDDEATGVIVNDDFCPRNTRYWMGNPDVWLVDRLVIGRVEYDKPTLLDLLDYSGPDPSHKLARELIATKLNLLTGSDRTIQALVNEADLFLTQHPPGSRPRGGDKKRARNLKDALNAYNNTACQ